MVFVQYLLRQRQYRGMNGVFDWPVSALIAAHAVGVQRRLQSQGIHRHRQDLIVRVDVSGLSKGLAVIDKPGAQFRAHAALPEAETK